MHHLFNKYLLNINTQQDIALGFTRDVKRSKTIFAVNKLAIFFRGVLVSVLLL